jgi:prepilin-type N-terminal cleavage/methylation domain-containing protein
MRRGGTRRPDSGFTILEIIIVLFLLGGLLSIVIPRVTLGESLSATGRKWVAVLRTLEDLSRTTQKPVRLYIDLDSGYYWPVLLEGNEEKPPLDPRWERPHSLPETVRIVDLQVGQRISTGGRADLYFYPNGKIDPVVMHLADTENNLLGIQVEPVTGNIRLADERIEPPRPWTIPDRVRPLLVVQAVPGGLKPPGQP